MSGQLEKEPLSIGQFLRSKRKEKGLNQEGLACKIGVRRQTIADLENGKNVGSRLLFAVIEELDFRLTLESKATADSATGRLKSHAITESTQSGTMDFDFPYDWPNTGNMPDKVLISKVIRGQRFMDIARLCKRFGIDHIANQIDESLYDDIRPKLEDIIGTIRSAVAA